MRSLSSLVTLIWRKLASGTLVSPSTQSRTLRTGATTSGQSSNQVHQSFGCSFQSAPCSPSEGQHKDKTQPEAYKKQRQQLDSYEIDQRKRG